MLKEATDFWNSIKSKVQQLVDNSMRKSLQCARYDVTSAPDGNKIGVTKPCETQEIFIPYSWECASAEVGDTVLVVWWNTLSTAKAWFIGGGPKKELNVKTGNVTKAEMQYSANIDREYEATTFRTDNNTGGTFPAEANATYGAGITLPWGNPQGGTTPRYAIQIWGTTSDDSGSPDGLFYRKGSGATWNAWNKVSKVHYEDVEITVTGGITAGTPGTRGKEVAYTPSGTVVHVEIVSMVSTSLVLPYVYFYKPDGKIYVDFYRATTGAISEDNLRVTVRIFYE